MLDVLYFFILIAFFIVPPVLLLALPLIVGRRYIIESGFFKKKEERKYPRYPIFFLVLPFITFFLYIIFVGYFSNFGTCTKLGFWLARYVVGGDGISLGASFLLFLPLVVILLILARRSGGPPRKVFITAITISIILFLYVGGMLEFIGLNTARVLTHDRRRIADLKQVELALGMYYDDHQTYPGNTWADLNSALVSPPSSYYMAALPVDPIHPNRQFEYKISPDKQKFVLRALLDKCSNKALDDDLDGIIYGLDCGDPQKRYSENQYCITSP